jgi:hypothetical protein
MSTPRAGPARCSTTQSMSNTETVERNGRVHQATRRLTVGYTVAAGQIQIYALVSKIK